MHTVINIFGRISLLIRTGLVHMNDILVPINYYAPNIYSTYVRIYIPVIKYDIALKK